MTRNILIAALCVFTAGPLPATNLSYHYLKEISLGGEAKWDYLVVDAQARRLYVSHHMLYNVIDLDKETAVGTITDTQGCHGFAFAPDLKRGFTTNGQESTSSIVDLGSLKTLSKVTTGEKPDSILFDPKNQEVYTFNGKGDSITVYKATTSEVTTTIPLPGKPEFVQLDPAAGMIYVNIEDKNEVVAVNTQTHQIANTWPVAPGEAPSSMAIDLASHRLFIGCDNKTMVVMDSATGKIVTSFPIGDGVDASVFDPGTKLIFSSCGKDGVCVIVLEDDPNHYTTVQTLKTAQSARTMAIDPTTHKIYFSSAFGDISSMTSGISDTQFPPNFRILIYGM
jgi:6-phosphogluconolactonase (cycloisomerase 2 family)